MTKAELEEEATTYALEWGTTTDGTYACCRDGYLAAAEPREKRIAELEAQIEKMKKYAKLLQDICTVMGNDPYMVWRGLEQRVLVLWDKSEEEKGLKMTENILDRLLKIKPQDWAEIERLEIKDNE